MATFGCMVILADTAQHPVICDGNTIHTAYNRSYTHSTPTSLHYNFSEKFNTAPLDTRECKNSVYSYTFTDDSRVNLGLVKGIRNKEVAVV